MITQSFFERYLEIQCHILNSKIKALKERAKSMRLELVYDFRLKSLLLERKKNKLIREYQMAKKTGSKNYESFVSNIYPQLQELCKLYNNLFAEVESFK